MLLFLPRDPEARRRVTRPPGAPALCAEPQQHRLSAFADEELSAATRALVWVHLRDCAVCRVRLAHTRALRTAVARSGARTRAPDSLRDRVHAVLSAAGSDARSATHNGVDVSRSPR